MSLTLSIWKDNITDYMKVLIICQISNYKTWSYEINRPIHWLQWDNSESPLKDSGSTKRKKKEKDNHC